MYYSMHVGDFLQFGGSFRIYTLTGPSEKMVPEEKVVLRDEDRRPKTSESSESSEKKYVKAPKIKIQFLGERHAQSGGSIQEQLQQATWGFDEDAVRLLARNKE